MLKKERVLLDVFFFCLFGFHFCFCFFIIIIICLLQANRADNDCPCGKENRWFGEKKETEKALKNRHQYWHASLPIFVSHSRCDWISHNYDIAQTYSMFYRHRSVLTLPALSKLVLRNWFLRKIPQKGHLYRDKWETSSEKRNTYELDGKSYLSRVLLLQVDTNQWKSIIDFNQYYR